MAVTTITSRQGETLDMAAWRALGLGAADLGVLLDLNPGLADLGEILPLGTVIAAPTPATPTTPTIDLINLWD